jgi:hypothetical protein
VKEHVNIPHHVQFWGIDSGIRHSVGGADYGSVRVGTFMGRRIIQGTASKLANSFKKTREEADDVELALSTEDAEEEYLCNIPPHRYTPLNRQSLCAPLSTRSEELVAVLLHAEVLNVFGIAVQHIPINNFLGILCSNLF